MSDVVLSTTESVTTVTVVDDIVQVAVTTNPVTVTTQTAGVQGASYNFGDPIYVTVRNATGATLTKGTIVYTAGAQGNHTLVQKASASGDATSARTLGWVSADIANNSDGFVVVEGYLDGIDTDHIAEGSQLYLSTVAGEFTATKPQAPVHLVYVGVVTKSNPGNGRVLVKVQNGYELEELHDVRITSPVNNQVLTYDSATDLWINATNPADGVTSITATAPLTGGTITSTGSIGLDQTALSITRSQVSDFSSGTVASAGTATYAINAGTAVFATTSGTATYATNSGTAVTISGSITQSQVTNLTTDLANTAKLNTANTFSVGGHVVNNANTGTVPIRINAITGQTANQMEFYNASGVLSSRIAADGAYVAGANSESFISGASFRLQITPASASTVAATIRGATSQTADLAQFQTSAGVNAVTIRPNVAGNWGNDAIVSSGPVQVSPTASATGYGLFVRSGAVGSIGLLIRGLASQTADLLNLQNSASVSQFRVDPAGMTIANSLGVAGSPSGISYAYFTTPVANAIPVVVRGAASQTQDLTQWQNNASTVLSEITSTGSFYVNTNNNTSGIEFLGTSGTQVIYANGNDLSVRPRFDLLFGPADSAGRLRPSNDNTSDLGTSGTRWRNVFASGLNLTNSTAGNVVATIRGAASQSANLTEWQNSSSTVLSRVTSTGLGSFDVLNAPNGAFFGNLVAQPGNGAYLAVQGYSAGHRPFLVRGFGATTANLADYQNGSGTVLGGRNANAQIFTGSTAPLAFGVGGATTATSGDGTTATITTTSAHNLAIGDRVTVAGITPTGYNGTFSVASVPTTTSFTYANATTGAQTVAGTVTLDSQASIVARSAGTFPLVVRGATNQNSDLTIWQNAAGSTLARMTPAGILRASQLLSLNGLASMGEFNNGAIFEFVRATAQSYSPGANRATLYFRDGTNPSTLRLCVRAGTAGAETTILDNIPT